MSEPKTRSVGENSLDQVLADYLKAADLGQTPDPTALLARHPQWKAELEAFFAAQDRFERWTGPLREVCATPSTVHEQPTVGADSIAPAAAPALGTFGDTISSPPSRSRTWPARLASTARLVAHSAMADAL